MRLGRQLNEVPVTDLVFGQQHQVIIFRLRPRALIQRSIGNIDLAPDDRLDSGLLRLVVELDRAKHRAVIGQCQSRHALLACGLEQVVDPRKAVEQRVGGVAVEMHEAICHGSETPQLK